MIASSSHSLTFFFQSVKISCTNSVKRICSYDVIGFQNLFREWGIVENFHLALPAGKLSPEYAMTSGEFPTDPSEKSIIAIPLPSSLLAITWDSSRPFKQKWMVFQVGGNSYPPCQLRPHLKCQENQHAKNQRNHKVHHIPTWQVCRVLFATTPLVCVFLLQKTTKGIWKTQKVYGKELQENTRVPCFLFPKKSMSNLNWVVSIHTQIFWGKFSRSRNSFRKHFPELKDNSYQTNRVMEKYLTESIETALETLKGWNILTTNSGGIWTKKNSAPRFDNFHKGEYARYACCSLTLGYG